MTDQVQGEAHWDCPIIQSNQDRVKVTKAHVTVLRGIYTIPAAYQTSAEGKSTLCISRTSLEGIAVLEEAARLTQSVSWLVVNFHVSGKECMRFLAPTACFVP